MTILLCNGNNNNNSNNRIHKHIIISHIGCTFLDRSNKLGFIEHVPFFFFLCVRIRVKTRMNIRFFYPYIHHDTMLKHRSKKSARVKKRMKTSDFTKKSAVCSKCSGVIEKEIRKCVMVFRDVNFSYSYLSFSLSFSSRALDM